MSKLGLAVALMFLVETSFFSGKPARADDYTVYQVFRAVDLGETDRQPPKEIFINMGSNQGVKKGSVLDVYRKISSFNNLTQRLEGDHMIPVGRIKVIHTDEKTSIARVDKFVSVDQEPAMFPPAVMIGDVVKPTKGED